MKSVKNKKWVWCTTSRRPFSELRRSYTTRFGPRGAHAKYFISFWSLPYCRLSTIQDNRLTVLQILYTIWDQIPRFLKKWVFHRLWMDRSPSTQTRFGRVDVRWKGRELKRPFPQSFVYSGTRRTHPAPMKWSTNLQNPSALHSSTG